MTPTTYCCIPQRKTRLATVLCVALLAAAIISFYFSNLFSSFRAVGQLVAMISLLFFVQITSKVFLTEYRYQMENGFLEIITVQGKRKKTLGRIPISSEIKLFSKQEWEERKKDFSVKNRFSYCQNLFPREDYVLLICNDRDISLLRFEPDEILVSLLKEQMKPKKTEEDV